MPNVSTLGAEGHPYADFIRPARGDKRDEP
jgi:hypothetical protein